MHKFNDIVEIRLLRPFIVSDERPDLEVKRYRARIVAMQNGQPTSFEVVHSGRVYYLQDFDCEIVS